jgi:hypothetical protein
VSAEVFLSQFKEVSLLSMTVKGTTVSPACSVSIFLQMKSKTICSIAQIDNPLEEFGVS